MSIHFTRRKLLLSGSSAIGGAALASLLGRTPSASAQPVGPHFAPRAKKVIFMFQSGAPSQIETFDPKPGLASLFGTELPDSVRSGQRLAQTAMQGTLPIAPSIFGSAQRGQSGLLIGDVVPHMANIADRLCVIRSMHTEAINHEPGGTMLQTGAEQAGRPSMGSWISYGLGSLSDNLPTFMVLLSKNYDPIAQPVYPRLWSSAFLPARHEGVKLRAGREQVLFLDDRTRLGDAHRRRVTDAVQALDRAHAAVTHDPELERRIDGYELAFKMQTSVPELVDLSDESDATFEMYGAESRNPGSYAANCLLARRLVQRGVRFVQLYHRGWDHHYSLPTELARSCRETDQASAALIEDLARHGLLEDTLVIWGGEFGRTVYSQGQLTATTYGRDHHPRCFSMWLAGAGVKPGYAHGVTDEFSYNIVQDPVHVHDLHATILHLLGIDHLKLTFPFQGRQFRLTDVAGQVVSGILS